MRRELTLGAAAFVVGLLLAVLLVPAESAPRAGTASGQPTSIGDAEVVVVVVNEGDARMDATVRASVRGEERESYSFPVAAGKTVVIPFHSLRTGSFRLDADLYAPSGRAAVVSSVTASVEECGTGTYLRVRFAGATSQDSVTSEGDVADRSCVRR